MSAEDRAREVLADYLARNARLTVMAYDTVAHELLEALSSEGLAVVPKADLRVVALTVRKLPTENVDLRNDIADHLRRLSGADQDG